MLSKETYLENLRSQYRDDIKMLIQECQEYGKSYLDVEKLNHKLQGLHSFVLSHDGLGEEDWLELIYELTPDIYDKLDFGIIAA